MFYNQQVDTNYDSSEYNINTGIELKWYTRYFILIFFFCNANSDVFDMMIV